MLKPVPSYNDEGNAVFAFFTGDNGLYKTQVVIDELNDNLLLNWTDKVEGITRCMCKDYEYRKRHCKHIKEIKTYLQTTGIEFREVEFELPTKDSVPEESNRQDNL